MIRKLRIKFICVIMSIVMLMLGIILGVMIYFTEESTEAQSINMMRAFAATPFPESKLGNGVEKVRLPCFAVQINKQGTVNGTIGGYFDLYDMVHAQQIVDAVMAADLEVGTLEEYDLRFLKTEDPRGYTIVFMDLTTEAMTMRNMILNCLILYLLAFIPFLGISILLSHWVIKPAERAWEQQRQFVADASHELKTPLSVIMANAELVQNDDISELERKDLSRNILSMTYQMRFLVENMLEMARVDSGALKIRFDTVDLSQLVNDAVLSFQLLYEEKGLGLRCDVQDGIRIHGSEQHLYQVMDVLLDNALKYSTPNGQVSVRLVHSCRNCLLTVTSPGEPISREDLKNIFKRFYRADKARAMDGSYGLGLSIAESIVSAHKGKIWAESKNNCNTFCIQL